MFDVWKLKRERKKTRRLFAPKIKKLQEEGASPEAIQAVEFDEWVAYRRVEDNINRLASRHLFDEARRYDVSPPTFDQPEMWHLKESGQYGWLSPIGRTFLRKRIDEEKARRFEVTTRWITKFWLPLLAALVGIIGALTGLAAVLQHKK